MFEKKKQLECLYKV